MPRLDPIARREWHREYMRKKYQTDPTHRKKQLARVKLKDAVDDGKIIKPERCKCGCATVQAHHDDYDKPLDVVWLCRECHRTLHPGMC